MNFQAALDVAQTEARSISNGISGCQLADTGLIVLVFGGEDDAALPDIPVTAAGNTVNTDVNGLARFVPIPAGEYVVRATRPEAAPHLAEPQDETARVPGGSRIIRTIHLPTTVMPHMKIVWAHDASPVAGVQLALLNTETPVVTTDELGVAAWGVRLRPYQYTVRVHLADVNYLLFDNRGSLDAIQTIRLPRVQALQTLYIRRSDVRFRIQRQVGATIEDLVGARVTLQGPVQEGVTALDGEQALASFIIPVTNKEQLKHCGPVTLVADGTHDVYEVVEVTSA